MATVSTIAGPIESAELGQTLSHEHLTSGMGGMERIPGLYDEDEGVRRCLEALQLAHDAGIRSIIDCTPLDLGRQVSLFQRLAGETPVNVIAATGVYRWVPLLYAAWDADYVAEYFLRDIQQGIEGSDVRAGIIKLAWDFEHRLTEGGPRALRALLEKCARGAARAAKAAGVPITCHTRARDEQGTPLLDIFEEEGLDLRAVTIGHSNDSDDLDYVRGLAERGATVGLDRFLHGNDEELARRSGVALAMVEGGYAEQTCLGHDAAAYSMNGGPPDGGPRPWDPDCWLRISNFELPWLRERGATDDDIDALMHRSVRATFDAAAAMAG
jgi:phosphotriesterase-related protein